VTPLPQLSGPDRAGASLEFTLDLTPDLPVFDGHFPDTPILPAVAQIDWALRLARAHFPLPPAFKAAHALKFLRIVQPPVKLSLVLEPAGEHAVSFTYSHRGSACSSGRIEFTDDATGTDRSLL
jgi:3-hydroxymyristoyl/3-hydroxydecanoyl-(acyl carrier protein) dehydratase